MIKVFISHSSADSSYAKFIADTLVEKLTNIQHEEVRCTSAPGFELPPGVDIKSTLRADLSGALLVVGLISRTSIQSQWVLFELGAAWGREARVVPVLLPGTGVDLLPPPISGVTATHWAQDASMFKLFQFFAKELKVRIRNQDALLAGIGSRPSPPQNAPPQAAVVAPPALKIVSRRTQWAQNLAVEGGAWSAIGTQPRGLAHPGLNVTLEFTNTGSEPAVIKHLLARLTIDGQETLSSATHAGKWPIRIGSKSMKTAGIFFMFPFLQRANDVDIDLLKASAHLVVECWDLDGQPFHSTAVSV